MEEVRSKIIEMVSQLPDNQLDGVLGYIEALVKLTELDVKAGEYLGKIMSEDDNLLKRLAQ